MKFNHLLFAGIIVICLFTATNTGADDMDAAVSNHNLIVYPYETTIVSGENAVINVKIQNTDEYKIIIKLDAGGVPDSWINYKTHLFTVLPASEENANVTVHIPAGRIGTYNVKIITRNPDTGVEVVKNVKIEALPPEDRGMSGIPIFPLAEQPILLILDIITLIVNGIISAVVGIIEFFG